MSSVLGSNVSVSNSGSSMSAHSVSLSFSPAAPSNQNVSISRSSSSNPRVAAISQGAMANHSASGSRRSSLQVNRSPSRHVSYNGQPSSSSRSNSYRASLAVARAERPPGSPPEVSLSRRDFYRTGEALNRSPVQPSRDDSISLDTYYTIAGSAAGSADVSFSENQPSLLNFGNETSLAHIVPPPSQPANLAPNRGRIPLIPNQPFSELPPPPYFDDEFGANGLPNSRSQLPNLVMAPEERKVSAIHITSNGQSFNFPGHEGVPVRINIMFGNSIFTPTGRPHSQEPAPQEVPPSPPLSLHRPVPRVAFVNTQPDAAPPKSSGCFGCI